MNREAIYQGLFNKLQSLSDFVVAERRLVKPEVVLTSWMPALFQIQKTETTEFDKQVHGTPVRRILNVVVRIYVNSPPPVDNGSGILQQPFPSSILNPIVDKLENLTKPEAFNRTQTLSGLVQYVKLGEIKYFEHLTSAQIMMEAPIEMMVIA